VLLQAGTNIAGRNVQPFVEGRRLFHTSFLTGAHTEAGNPTLFTTQAGKAGPKFQQAACIQCHLNNGKSTPALASPLNTMVVLTGDNDSKGNPVTDSRFGGHLSQGLVVDGATTYDGRQAILKIDSYQAITAQYPDHAPYTLHVPHYVLTDTTGKPLDLPARMSVRAAPHLAGMGLLEAVPESALEALAATSARDPDGAVGRLQIVSDLQDPGIRRVGRFGWRGSAATVLQQTAFALDADMGVTTSILPKHLCGQASSGADCRVADAKGPELSDADLELLVRYTSLLAVPPQRHFAGEQPLGVPATTILAQGANPDVRYLHDGRARTVEEAILWHGGQATASRDRSPRMIANT
jgi:CxxC motif-containing protein (DUF1111 family)